jgi:hypothetical protein
LALVPGDVPLLSLYDMPCGLAVFEGTVGETVGATVVVTVGETSLVAAKAVPPTKAATVVRTNGASLRIGIPLSRGAEKMNRPRVQGR